MTRRRLRQLLNTILTIAISVLTITAVFILVHENIENKVILEGTCKRKPNIAPSLAEGRTLSHEIGRFVHHLNYIETTSCASIQLIGEPNTKQSEEPQDLRAKSYVCLGGRHGLIRQGCLVYSFGIKHPWIQFSELVEKEFGCNVYVFEPAVNFIDHYHSKKIRFFNARLSDFDRQAQYKVPGEEGWKYRKFITIIKEKHFQERPIDVVRLDVTLDLWRGMSSMLSDGSLICFAKQLTMEYDLQNKNITEVREMFGIAQWLKRQGFRLVHSQATKTSKASYAVTYVNDRIANSPSSEMVKRREAATPSSEMSRPKDSVRTTAQSKRSTLVRTSKVADKAPSVHKRSNLAPTPKVTEKAASVSKRSTSAQTSKVTKKPSSVSNRSTSAQTPKVTKITASVSKRSSSIQTAKTTGKNITLPTRRVLIMP